MKSIDLFLWIDYWDIFMLSIITIDRYTGHIYCFLISLDIFSIYTYLFSLPSSYSFNKKHTYSIQISACHFCIQSITWHSLYITDCVLKNFRFSADDTFIVSRSVIIAAGLDILLPTKASPEPRIRDSPVLSDNLEMWSFTQELIPAASGRSLGLCEIIFWINSNSSGNESLKFRGKSSLRTPDKAVHRSMSVVNGTRSSKNIKPNE